MSAADEDADEPSLPRATTVLFGQGDAERILLEAYQGGRLPHAWLIGGPAGIGKATLAYRMARFVLAHPDPRAPAVQSASSLHVDADHPVARRIAAQAQGDLLVLERTINEKTNKLRQAFRAIAAAEKDRCVLIDATRSVDRVADDIWAVVNARLDPAHAPISFEDLHA